jgi:hypothetical protein
MFRIIPDLAHAAEDAIKDSMKDSFRDVKKICEGLKKFVDESFRVSYNHARKGSKAQGFSP